MAVPSRLIATRMQGDDYHRLDRVTFRVPDLKAMVDFSKELSSLVTVNHRLQDDFRLDDVKQALRAAAARRATSTTSSSCSPACWR